MKNEKTKLIIWALVALVIGVVIGMIITNATTGNANVFLKGKSNLSVRTDYMCWCTTGQYNNNNDPLYSPCATYYNTTQQNADIQCEFCCGDVLNYVANEVK